MAASDNFCTDWVQLSIFEASQDWISSEEPRNLSRNLVPVTIFTWRTLKIASASTRKSVWTTGKIFWGSGWYPYFGPSWMIKSSYSYSMHSVVVAESSVLNNIYNIARVTPSLQSRLALKPAIISSA